MIALVSRAEAFLDSRGAWDVSSDSDGASTSGQRTDNDRVGSLVSFAALRREVSAIAGGPMIMTSTDAPKFAAFARRVDIADLSQQGPATPDHVIRTKRLPMLGRDVEGFARAYKAYFERNARLAKEPKTMLDPAPRMLLDPELGFLCARPHGEGRAHRARSLRAHDRCGSAVHCAWAGIARCRRKTSSTSSTGISSRPSCVKAASRRSFAGEVALVTGAASGIGKACVEAFLKRGAAVVGARRRIRASRRSLEAVPNTSDRLRSDRPCRGETRRSTSAVKAFGGIDMLVFNAGIFPGGRNIAGPGPTRNGGASMRSTSTPMSHCCASATRSCKLAPGGGRVVVIGSKNVPAPGPGRGGVFRLQGCAHAACPCRRAGMGRRKASASTSSTRTRCSTPESGPKRCSSSRAAHYDLSVEEYKKKQRPQNGGSEQRRRRDGGRNVRAAIRKDHGCPGAGRWRK